MTTIRFGRRRRWLGVAAAAAIGVTAGSVGLTNAVGGQAGTGDATSFVPIEPCRVLDTRAATQVGDISVAFVTDDEKTIGAHGAAGECDISSDVVALSLNVTAVGATAGTFLTVHASDVARPTSSNMNPGPHELVTANAVTTELSADGDFTVYNAFGSVDVIIDLIGVYIPAEAVVGPQGPAGPVGPAGADGPQGPAGVEGAQGPAGADGQDGAQGPAGPAGADGQDGAQGPAGQDGVDGEDGAQGPAGQDGVDGEDGAQGPAGQDGADGQDGASPTAWFADTDGDSFGDPTDVVFAVVAPPMRVADATDCNDDDANTYPGAPDAFGDGIDQSCSDLDRDGVPDSVDDCIEHVSWSSDFGGLVVPEVITTVAGIDLPAYSGDGCLATQAGITDARNFATFEGSLYFTEVSNHVVRRIDRLTGVISTVAGNGTAGDSGDGGPATSAELNAPNGLAISDDGILYIGDNGNGRIRAVDLSTGLIDEVAPIAPAFASAGMALDGDILYFAEGRDEVYAIDLSVSSPTATPVASGFNTARDVAVLDDGSLVVADSEGHRVWHVDPVGGVVTPFAGIGSAGSGPDGIAAVDSALNRPYGVAVDPDGDVIIAGFFTNSVRRVDTATGVITTIAGSGAPVNTGDFGPAGDADTHRPIGVHVDPSGNIWLALTGVGTPPVDNNWVRVIGGPEGAPEADQRLFFRDGDGDGFGIGGGVHFGTLSDIVLATTAPAGFVDNALDCDDLDPMINPDGTEVLDSGLDEDCDGVNSATLYPDADGDFFSTSVGSIVGDALQPPAGYLPYLTMPEDCQDGDPLIPGFDVPGDGIDQDCDGSDASLDLDGDGFDGNFPFDSCSNGIDDDADGHTDLDDPQCRLFGQEGPDCDDYDPSINPGASEAPGEDFIDSDCDGLDNDDIDGDGYVVQVFDPFGNVTGDDCNDYDPLINPGATDTPDDAIDQNCDFEDSRTFWADVDGDSFGDDMNTLVSVPDEFGQAPAGYVYANPFDGPDCDDTDPLIHPFADENPGDGVDSNCDGSDDT